MDQVASGDLSGRWLGTQNRLLERMRSGGMADIYRAERDGELVAVKVLRPHPDRRVVEEIRRRFRKEWVLIESIDHPNVVRVIDYVEEQGVCGLVMPLIDGGDLSDLLDRAPPKPAEALELLAQVADGLACLAGARVVHRDLKPSNILITEVDGVRTALISDFGIGAALDETYMTGRFTWGTAAYTAPELLNGGPPRPAADIYALGIMSYQLLAASMPVYHRWRPVRPQGMPEDLWAIVEGMLEKNPQDRPSARRVADGFRALSSTVSDAEPFRVSHPVLAPQTADEPALRVARAADTGRLTLRERVDVWAVTARTRGLGLTLSTIAVVVGLVGAIWLVADRRTPSQPAAVSAPFYGKAPSVTTPVPASTPLFTETFSRPDSPTWGDDWARESIR